LAAWLLWGVALAPGALMAMPLRLWLFMVAVMGRCGGDRVAACCGVRRGVSLLLRGRRQHWGRLQAAGGARVEPCAGGAGLGRAWEGAREGW
jgi:hypothetical protein